MRYTRISRLKSNKVGRTVGVFAIFLLVSTATYAQVGKWQELLDSTDPEKRIRGVLAAANLGDPEAMVALGRELNDENAFVRAAARKGVQSQDKAGIEWLLEVSDPIGSPAKVRNANHLLEFLSDRGDATPNQFDPDTEKRILAKTTALRCRESICMEKWARPIYPPLAYSAAIAGRVWVTFAVDQNGKPIEISAEGPPLIVTAAKDAVAKWQFTRGHEQASSKQIVLVEYQLSEPSGYTREVVSEMVFPNYVLVSAKRLR